MSGIEEGAMSPAEWKVMRIVWRLEPCAARDVVAAAREAHGWSPSTVKTLLRRLVDKRQLKTRRIGNSFLYRPSKPPLGSLLRAADKLLENTLDGTTGPFAAKIAKPPNVSRT